jgi:hypothetical protein
MMFLISYHPIYTYAPDGAAIPHSLTMDNFQFSIVNFNKQKYLYLIIPMFEIH